jgi:tetratricopeptide (TPR) repeat protein
MDNEIVEKAMELEDNGDLKECIKYIDENIGSIQDELTKTDALRIKSECFLYQEVPDSEMARKYAEEALKISSEKGDQKRIAETNLLLSQILVLEDTKKAIEYGRKAMELYQKINDKNEYIYSMISLATILEDFNEASSLFEKAMQEATNANNLDMLAQAAVNYAYLLVEQKGGDAPLNTLDKVIKKILAEAAKLKRKEERIRAVTNYSEIFDAASDIAMELDAYDQATKYASYLNKDPQEFVK